MAALVLTLRFACELAALGALAWWGHSEGGIVVAIGLPLVAATLWGLTIAPRAKHRLHDPWRFATESLVWIGAIASLVGVDRSELAIGFGIVAFSTAIGARKYEPAAVGLSASR